MCALPPALLPRCAGSKNGPTASRPSVLLLDPSKCYWEVLWENGRTEELAVGTQPSHTCLRVSAPLCAPLCIYPGPGFLVH